MNCARRSETDVDSESGFIVDWTDVLYDFLLSIRLLFTMHFSSSCKGYNIGGQKPDYTPDEISSKACQIILKHV